MWSHSHTESQGPTRQQPAFCDQASREEQMSSFKPVIAAFFVLAASTPASSQAIEGKTPKGIAYRYQRVTAGENVAVYFGWRYVSADEATERALLSYVVPAMTFGAG